MRDDLLEWIDETERREARQRESVDRLLAENERLRRELGKLRTSRLDPMSSRLKDALRE
ncbi:hypothetical protein [Paenibacillus sp. GYB003]|uniref:hypothetical protein n=1 Tax=Paenibacillus sp. GYB003 TaxID=2994392 RepID=UPI002F961A02